MAGTIGGLPYPTGTDKVVDGDDAIRALATAVDRNPLAAAYAANRVLVPFAAGWADVSAGNPLAVFAASGWVTLDGRVIRNSGSSLIIGTIPAGYRPPVQLLFIMGSYNGAAATAGPGLFTNIDTNGVITITPTTSPALGSTTIIPIHVTFPRA